jgi:hypothetical protein
MRAAGYSLAEVLVAAAVLMVALAAASVLVSSLVIRQELDSGAVRASNIQEQAAMLYRLGVTSPQDIYSILPESCGSSGAPAAGSFSLLFTAPSQLTAAAAVAAGGFADVSYEATSCTVVYGSPVGSGGQLAYSSNTVTILRPAIRVGP